MHVALPFLSLISGSYLRLAVGWFVRFVFCSPISTVSVGETHMPPNATFTLPVLDIAVLVASSTDVFGIKVIVLESVKRTWLEFVTVRTPEKGSSRVFRMILITHLYIYIYIYINMQTNNDTHGPENKFSSTWCREFGAAGPRQTHSYIREKPGHANAHTRHMY